MDTFQKLLPNDAETKLVERIRYNVARIDRIRWQLIAFYGVLAAGLIIVFGVGLGFLRPGIPGLGLGFAIGASLGALFGLNLVSLGHGLMSTLLGVGKDTRLLLKYHDALVAVSRGERQ